MASRFKDGRVSLFYMGIWNTILSKRSRGGGKVLAIFGSAAATGSAGLLHNPLVMFLMVVLGIFIFLKFCGWAKKFQLAAGVKKIIYILTGVGLIGFNIYYSMGNKAILAGGDWSVATNALLASLIWVFIFAFALMAQTKSE